MEKLRNGPAASTDNHPGHPEGAETSEIAIAEQALQTAREALQRLKERTMIAPQDAAKRSENANERILSDGRMAMSIPAALMRDETKPNLQNATKWEVLKSQLEAGLAHKDEKIRDTTQLLCQRLSTLPLIMKNPDSGFEIVQNVHEIGKEYYSLLKAIYESDPASHAQADVHIFQYGQAINLALKLNIMSDAKYRVYVPVVAVPFNTLEMFGGASGGTVSEVLSWGVRNSRGAVEGKAVVRT